MAEVLGSASRLAKFNERRVMTLDTGRTIAVKVHLMFTEHIVVGASVLTALRQLRYSRCLHFQACRLLPGIGLISSHLQHALRGV
jgi:hypothetical protein